MDSHRLQNVAPPLPIDISIFQQILTYTFKDLAPPHVSIRSDESTRQHGAGSQTLEASKNANPIYYNHWYNNASVIDSILLGGSDYYILATDNLKNLVIDIAIDATLVERSPKDDSDGKYQYDICISITK
jgi:hypothetical protein